MVKSVLLILIFCFGVAVFIISRNLHPTPPAISNSIIYIQRDNDIYAYNLASHQETHIVHGTNGAIYAPAHQLAYSVADPNGLKHTIMEYDLTTQKSQQLLTVEGPLRALSFSPDGTYLLANFGSSVSGNTQVYNLQTKQQTANITETGHAGLFSNNDTLYFQQFKPTNAPRPWEAGDGTGIYSVSLATGIVTPIMPPTDLADFGILSIKNNTLYIQKTAVANKAAWNQYPDGLQTTYLTSDLSGGNIQSISHYTDPNTPPIAHAGNITKNPTDPAWIIYNIDDGGSVYKEQVFLAQQNNLKNAKALTTGLIIDWVQK